MTEIKATVVEFDLHPHPNADLLSIARLRGKEWQCVVKTEDMTGHHLGIYIPIDALVPISNPSFTFLTDKAKDGQFRIKTIRLRQALSQGLLIRAPNGSKVGDDFTEELGVRRWEPKIPAHLAGDIVREPGNFQKYTSIENWKNYPSVFKEGDLVRVTEKIHGTNCRFGCVDDGNIAGLTYLVGTHKTARAIDGNNLYSRTSIQLGLESKIKILADAANAEIHFIVFGEIYGSGVQDLTYGLSKETKFRIFDVLIDHKYQTWEMIKDTAQALGVDTVPLLSRGPFSTEEVLALRDGKTTLGEAHVREGVVVVAEPEAQHPEIGRKMLKFISDDYLLRRGATDGH